MYVKTTILALLAIGLIGSATAQNEQNTVIGSQAVPTEEYYRPQPTVKPYRPKPTYTQPSYTEPSYNEPSYTEPSYSEPTVEPTYSEPSYTKPSYTKPTEYPTSETKYEPEPTYVPKPHPHPPHPPHKCISGKMTCKASGKSPIFYACNFGQPIKMTCGAGTLCYNGVGGNIVCDYPNRGLSEPEYDNY
ncbi:hypothetical protein H4R34_001431 [Dimargaris verticillata]|uniref:Carbohydrate-binding module family 19 domain-containing protein n=1 Tax=Dimargaris verticillata TaxID=2761393 RepID=A0A9W8BAT3_9FUNG|nr:hypothetical protein H4R34_001431 [Dimargaris verticillata]